jgi:choline dehydrogenase-like flavoprotein
MSSDVFDFIVVGAGTAGCVLANRLSADPSVRVALIEAGSKDSHPWIHIPAAVGAAIVTPELGWGYFTAPQQHMGGRRIPIPRGRVLGGCSSMNGMVYNRGQPADYDGWAAMGNPGWSYREVLPYFVRSERNERFEGSPLHGRSGEMAVTDIRRTNPMNEAFFQAMEELQVRRCPDFNSLDPEGYGLRQATIRGGRRESSVTAFLRPVRDRRNLEVITDAPARRVLIEEGRAVGVEVSTPAGIRQIKARREVVLAGGAIGSPQLLLLSGVGDGEALKALGVEVRHHLPGVGRNLQDHLAVLVQMVMDDPTSYGISLKSAPRGAWNILEYLLFRQGPLASFVFEANAFIRSRPELERPDLQLVFQPARRNQNTFPIPVGHGFVGSSVLLYPKSRGSVSLASPDPAAAAVIDPNLLSDPDDYDPLVRAIRFCRRAFASPAFARYQASEFKPGGEVQDDEALRAYIRDTGSTVHHPAGTCRMGPGEDAVVDPELRVHGVEGLRVADASIMPRLVGGNTNAVVVMIAEKAADLILGRAAPQPIDVQKAA